MREREAAVLPEDTSRLFEPEARVSADNTRVGR
jgi:hypothetical protein